MYNYMTPLTGIAAPPPGAEAGGGGRFHSRAVRCSGHDLQSLLFAFLDELLFLFHTEMLVLKDLTVARIDRESWTLEAAGCAAAPIRGACLPSVGPPCRPPASSRFC